MEHPCEGIQSGKRHRYTSGEQGGKVDDIPACIHRRVLEASFEGQVGGRGQWTRAHIVTSCMFDTYLFIVNIK